MRLFLIFFLLFSSALFAAQSDCPVQLALTDTSGNSITTAVDYEVHFYSASTAGTELITAETGTSTPSSGLLRIPLSCDATLISNPNIFLEFIINGETLTPRVEMTASPFAATAFSVAGNSITLGTDTVGNYIQSLTAGTGINITGTSGEGAALTISATGGLSTGSVTTTEILDGTIATADIADNSIATAKIQDNAVTLGTKTTGNYVDTLTAGTGISSTGATSGEGISHTLSVDQTFSPTWTGNHRFNGNVGIGKAPAVPLDIIGNTSLSGNLSVGGIISSGCATGFANAGDYCIQINERGTDTWLNAIGDCFTINAGLCSPQQWYAACINAGPLGLSNMLDNEELTSQLSAAAFVFNMGLNNACSDINVSAIGANTAYRCCYTK